MVLLECFSCGVELEEFVVLGLEMVQFEFGSLQIVEIDDEDCIKEIFYVDVFMYFNSVIIL